MKNDLQIAKEIELKPITEIAEQLNIFQTRLSATVNIKQKLT